MLFIHVLLKSQHPSQKRLGTHPEHCDKACHLVKVKLFSDFFFYFSDCELSSSQRQLIQGDSHTSGAVLSRGAELHSLISLSHSPLITTCLLQLGSWQPSLHVPRSEVLFILSIGPVSTIQLVLSFLGSPERTVFRAMLK